MAQAGTIGSYGTFAIDSAGAWTYTASSEHNEFEDGTTYTDTFAVASADGTTTSVTINILGTMACTRFRGHRVRCHSGAGGGLWNANAMHESSSLRL